MGARLAAGVAVAWLAAGCGGSGRAEHKTRMPMPPLIVDPVDAEPAPRAAEPAAAEPAAPSAPANADKAPWYCYALWDADDPQLSTTGCTRKKRMCGRQRWQRAREARDDNRRHIRTQLCEPHETVACFDYRVQNDDAKTSCHPTEGDCERVRVANLDNRKLVEISRCNER